MRQLSEPFPPSAIKMRADGKKGNDNKARCVPYIDARTVTQRLNRVLGGDGWKTRMTVLNSGAVLCRLSVRYPGKTEWISREDVGGKSQQPDEDDQVKAAVSDAIKRTAVQFGVGAYLYRLPKYRLEIDQYQQIVEKWSLPLWALPDDYKPAGPQHAAALHRLADVLCKASGRDLNGYVRMLLDTNGYTHGTPFAELERRHVKVMMQKVNADVEEHAKQTGPGLNMSAVSDKPLADQGDRKKCELPKTGPDLYKWLCAADERCCHEGYSTKNALVADVISAGAKAGYSTSIDEWTGGQITFAVETARELYTTWKKSGKRTPTKANEPSGVA